MSTVRIVTIVCWIIAALALIGLVIFFVTGSIFGFGAGRFGGNWSVGGISNFENLSGSFEVQGEHSVTDARIDSININWTAGEITVQPHNGNDIRIIESAQRELRSNEVLQYSISGNTLIINFFESNSNIMRSAPRKNLEVLVPQALSESMDVLDVSTVSGNIDIFEITANVLNCDSTSARIGVSGSFNRANLGNVSGSTALNNMAENSIADVDTVSGSTSLVGSFDRVSVSAVSGSTTIESIIVPSSLDVSSVSGRVDIYVPDTGEAISVNHSSVSGGFDFSIPVLMQSGSAQFRISTVSGRATIQSLPGFSN